MTERKLILKGKAYTDPHCGKAPSERTVDEHILYGVVNLDKPRGPTSHEVVSWIKKMLGVSRAGHGGTLDPKVTGVLPVALEESTKVLQAFLHAGKEYVCVMRMHDDIEEKRLKEVCREFTGKIIQRPPVKSAVKRLIRVREVYYLEILDTAERDVLFKVGCDAGTYIRKLCHDIGEVIGCGAHMIELRRTRSGYFTEDSAVSLHDLVDAYAVWKENGSDELIKKAITSIEDSVKHLPAVVVRDGAVDAICHGADLAVPGLSKLDAEISIGSTVAIFTLKGELIAIGEAKMDTKGMLVEDSGIAVEVKRVVMKPGTYPKMWKSRGGK